MSLLQYTRILFGSLVSYIDLTSRLQLPMAEVLEAELFDEPSSTKFMTSLLIVTLLISAIFIAFAYSPSDEDDSIVAPVSYTHLTLPTKA